MQEVTQFASNDRASHRSTAQKFFGPAETTPSAHLSSGSVERMMRIRVCGALLVLALTLPVHSADETVLIELPIGVLPTT